MLLLLYLRLTIGLIFLAAGLTKVRNPRPFQQAIRNFRILPSKAAQQMAPLIVAAEVGGGILLVLGIASWLGAALLGLLTVGFIYGLVANILKGRRDLDCRCFGRSSGGIGWAHVAQDAVLLVGTVLIIVLENKSPQAFQWSVSLDLAEGLASRTALFTHLLALYTAAAFLIFQEVFWMRRELQERFNRRPVVARQES
ncbi:MAG: DoxX family membrane protein [Acidobacteria bacterium]|nr:DoxX family membrane protein [Acidobacteriota bacterium]